MEFKTAAFFAELKTILS